MKIIAKGRGKGKTTELIKMSAEKQIPIVCMQSSYNYILDTAKNMGLEIPKPIVFNLQNIKTLNFKGVSGDILIDNADSILRNIFNDKDIKSITMSVSDRDELETDDIKDNHSDTIKSLKEDERNITKQLRNLVNTDKHNEYIACIKKLKETMNLIHEYDWQDNYSKYRTGNDNHLEVATWKQNSDGDIKDYHHYEVNKESDAKEFKELEKALNDMGISTRINDTYRPMNEVITDMERMWKKFDDNFQKDFSSMISGDRMANTFNALMRF